MPLPPSPSKSSFQMEPGVREGPGDLSDRVALEDPVDPETLENLDLPARCQMVTRDPSALPRKECV